MAQLCEFSVQGLISAQFSIIDREALSIADTDGCDRVSAQKFVSPSTYLILVVNSAI